MLQLYRALWCHAFIALVLAANFCSSTRVDGAELPEVIVRGLQSNVAALSPITVSWEQTRSSHLPLNELLEIIKRPGEKGILFPESYIVTLQDGKVSNHVTQKQWVKGGVTMYNEDSLFDGRDVYITDRSIDEWQVNIFDSNYRKSHYPKAFVMHNPYFDAAGFKIHNRMATIQQPPESEVLDLIAQGYKITKLFNATEAGMNLFAVELGGHAERDVFYLNPTMQYAVVKHEKFNTKNQLTQAISNMDFVELPSPSFWLPKHSRILDYTWYTNPDAVETAPIIQTDIVVKELNQERVTNDVFVVNYLKRPGTTVIDSRPGAAEMPASNQLKDGTYMFRIAPTADDLAKVILRPGSKVHMIGIIITCCVIAVLGSILIVRHYRHRHVSDHQ